MSDYEDADDVLSLYSQQAEKEISSLGKTIVALRAKIGLLENSLERERERVRQEQERIKKLPIPPSIISQIASLTDTLNDKDEEIEYYKKYVQPAVIINRLSKLDGAGLRRSGGLGSRAKLGNGDESDEEIDFYTNYVQKPLTINKKPKDQTPSRKGGLNNTTQ